MTNQYIRLETAPGLNHPGYPTCDACGLETRLDDGQWLCEGCGTAWSSDSMEHPPDAAMLYEEWSGEAITGPICPNEYAWRVSRLPPEERESWIKEYA